MSDMGSILAALTKSYEKAIVEQLEKPLLWDQVGAGPLINRPLWRRSPFYVCPLLAGMWDQVHVKPLPMTVNKLIHVLSQFPPDMLVYTQDSEYGSEEVSNVEPYEWIENVVMLE